MSLDIAGTDRLTFARPSAGNAERGKEVLRPSTIAKHGILLSTSASNGSAAMVLHSTTNRTTFF